MAVQYLVHVHTPPTHEQNSSVPVPVVAPQQAFVTPSGQDL
jgi:hypothetical protein